MPLRLPDKRCFSDEEVLAAISSYKKEYPAVMELFDRTMAGPHDNVTPMDILAVNALNGYTSPPMNQMTDLWVHREEVLRSVRPVTMDGIYDLADDEVEREVENVANALAVIDRVKGGGYGYVSTAKFFHRLRPNVGAIWDGVVAAWYSGVGTWPLWLRKVYRDVREDRNRCCLRTVQAKLQKDFGLCVSPLRIWDIVLWHMGRKKG